MKQLSLPILFFKLSRRPKILFFTCDLFQDEIPDIPSVAEQSGFRLILKGKQRNRTRPSFCSFDWFCEHSAIARTILLEPVHLTSCYDFDWSGEQDSLQSSFVSTDLERQATILSPV